MAAFINVIPTKIFFTASNEDILNFFQSKRTQDYLENIFNGSIRSERHDIVCSMLTIGRWNSNVHTKISRLASAQFLEDDEKIDLDLWKIVSQIFERVDFSRIRPYKYNQERYEMGAVENDKYNYSFYVLIPEGIVKFIQESNGCNKEKAEDFFVNLECWVSQEQLNDFEEELALDQLREREKEKLKIEDSKRENALENSTEYSNDLKFELPDIDIEETTGFKGDDIDFNGPLVKKKLSKDRNDVKKRCKKAVEYRSNKKIKKPLGKII